MAETIQVVSSTGTRLTPRWVLDLAIEVMGKIDLDPCSEPGPPWNVPARVHYTRETDCRTKPWCGKVWLNPPWAKKRGLNTILEHGLWQFEQHRVNEMLILLRCDPSTSWWAMLNQYPWLAFDKRLKFDGMSTGHTVPASLFYLGDHLERFAQVFDPHGVVYIPWGI